MLMEFHDPQTSTCSQCNLECEYLYNLRTHVKEHVVRAVLLVQQNSASENFLELAYGFIQDEDFLM